MDLVLWIPTNTAIHLTTTNAPDYHNAAIHVLCWTRLSFVASRKTGFGSKGERA